MRLLYGLAFAALASFPASLPAYAAQHTVTIANMAFSPATLTIAAGDTVTFVNKDGVPHTATGKAFNTGTLAPGAAAQLTFTHAGKFSYVCSIHSSMKGTIVVQ